MKNKNEAKNSIDTFLFGIHHHCTQYQLRTLFSLYDEIFQKYIFIRQASFFSHYFHKIFLARLDLVINLSLGSCSIFVALECCEKQFHKVTVYPMSLVKKHFEHFYQTVI